VPLAGFSLEGGARRVCARYGQGGQRDGFVFSVEHAPAGSTVALELKAVSDAWLHERTLRKGLQPRSFQGGVYCAVSDRRTEAHGVIEAFANVWPGGAGGDVAVDLMRSKPDIPSRRWKSCCRTDPLGQGRGLSHLRSRHGARLPGWRAGASRRCCPRIGAFIYRHGGSFYGFGRFARFQEKIRSGMGAALSAAPMFRLPAALGRTALLTTGGLRKMLAG